MKIKEYLKQNKEKIKYGSILICATVVAYTMGKRNGAIKAMISVKEPLLSFSVNDLYLLSSAIKANSTILSFTYFTNASPFS